MPYPKWQCYPANFRPPEWVSPLIQIVADVESTISTVAKNGPKSDGVLASLAPGLSGMGFAVETGKARAQKIRRPVLFGENGREAVSYEIDAFHDGWGIAVEVEAGRGAQNNADYRDLIRASLILDARHLVLLMPQHYRFQGSPPDGVQAYSATRDLLSALYASQRLRLPFDGVQLIGY